MPASNRKRILIVGGGFAGVFTAMHLETQLRKPKLVDAVETVLVNRENYFVFQPMLPEVISGSRTGDVPDASEGAGSWCRAGAEGRGTRDGEKQARRRGPDWNRA